MSDDIWIAVATADSVGEGAVVPVQAEGKSVALYLVEGQFYATDNVCTHGHALLSDGWLDGYEVECPLHGGRFDIKTGLGLCAPITEDIRSYSTRVIDGQVQIKLVE